MSEMFPREIFLEVNGHNAVIKNAPTLTSGTVGLPVRFQFDEAWDGLTKVAVFRAGDKTVNRLNIGNETTVPHEVMQRRYCRLTVGVYGVNADGTVVIPTVYAPVGEILPGADPSGDESADPSAPIWQNAVMKDPENSVSRQASAVGADCFAGAKAYQVIAKGADDSVDGANGYYVLAADCLPKEKIVGQLYTVTMLTAHQFAGVICAVGDLETGLDGIDQDGNHTTGLTGFKIYVSGYLEEALGDHTAENWDETCNTFRIPEFPLLGNKDYGIGAWAEGCGTKAVGVAAHAEGAYNSAYGDFSHVGGVGNVSFHNFQTVVGTYNQNKEDTVFEVGVGSGNSNQKNGFEVKKDGSARVLAESTEPDAVVRYSQLASILAHTGGLPHLGNLTGDVNDVNLPQGIYNIMVAPAPNGVILGTFINIVGGEGNSRNGLQIAIESYSMGNKMCYRGITDSQFGEWKWVNKTLTFTGAVTGTYDGNSDVVIDVPALTGVKTVNGVAPDENGNVEVAGGSTIAPLIFTGAVNVAYTGEAVTVVDIPTAEKGDPGYTPIKGIDYYTEADKAEMVNAVLAALPAAEGVAF